MESGGGLVVGWRRKKIGWREEDGEERSQKPQFFSFARFQLRGHGAMHREQGGTARA